MIHVTPASVTPPAVRQSQPEHVFASAETPDWTRPGYLRVWGVLVHQRTSFETSHASRVVTSPGYWARAARLVSPAALGAALGARGTFCFSLFHPLTERQDAHAHTHTRGATYAMKKRMVSGAGNESIVGSLNARPFSSPSRARAIRLTRCSSDAAVSRLEM